MLNRVLTVHYHNCPNLLYVTYLHDVLYVCTTSICFLFSQRDHNENKVYFWPVLCYPCHSILIVKLLDTYIVFCKVVSYTHLLYLFVVANKYLLKYLLITCCENYFLSMFCLLAFDHFLLNQRSRP